MMPRERSQGILALPRINMRSVTFGRPKPYWQGGLKPDRNPSAEPGITIMGKWQIPWRRERQMTVTQTTIGSQPT
jgi:hypothetical protein